MLTYDKIILLSGLVLLFGVLIFQPIQTQSLNPIISTPTDNLYIPNSIFEYDTCYPPCWLGIIPGITTVEDVLEIMLNQNNVSYFNISPDSILSPQNEQIVIEGSYLFLIEPSGEALSTIFIKNQLVYAIRLFIRNDFNFEDITVALGSPNSIYASNSLYTSSIDFIYEDYNLMISLIADRDNCRSSYFEQDFKAYQVVYYTDEFFENIIAEDWIDIKDSRNLNYSIIDEWFNNSDTSCDSAISELLRSDIFDITPPTP